MRIFRRITVSDDFERLDARIEELRRRILLLEASGIDQAFRIEMLEARVRQLENEIERMQEPFLVLLYVSRDPMWHGIDELKLRHLRDFDQFSKMRLRHDGFSIESGDLATSITNTDEPGCKVNWPLILAVLTVIIAALALIPAYSAEIRGWLEFFLSHELLLRIMVMTLATSAVASITRSVRRRQWLPERTQATA